MTPTPPASDLNRPTQSRAWLAFFAVLIVMGVAGVMLPLVYNLGQQLTGDQLEKAREQWRSDGPTDYDLTFSIRYDGDQIAERHIVLVRDGKASFAACEGEIVYAAPALGSLVGLSGFDAERQRPRDMPAIFQHIADLLKDQEESDGKNFLAVVFDPRNGYPRRVVRRVRRSSTREEWQIRLWLSGELAAKAIGGNKP
jgi:PAS domain-containing protein